MQAPIDNTQQSARPIIAGDPVARRPRILVADDSAVNRKLLLAILGKED